MVEIYFLGHGTFLGLFRLPTFSPALFLAGHLLPHCAAIGHCPMLLQALWRDLVLLALCLYGRRYSHIQPRLLEVIHNARVLRFHVHK